MSSYKVGDLASLVTPSSNNTGNKLQSLFNEHWNRKGNSKAGKKAKNIKSPLKSFDSDHDVKSISTKKTKKKRVPEIATATHSPQKSPKKDIETDFNSDFLPLHGKKKRSKDDTLNQRKKQRKSFSENSVGENANQNVEQPKKVKAFIRTAKSKRQKTAEEEEEDTMGVKPEHVNENLFSESADNENLHQSKKQKKKSKSNKSFKTASAFSSGEMQNQKVDFLDQSDFENKNDDSSADTDIENEKVESLGQTDVENKKVKAEKIRQENIKDLPCTIFVGNLPVSVTRKMLHKLFLSFGQIKSARLRGAVSTKLSIPKKVAEIKHEYHKGLQSHTGFVVFKNEKSANNALSLNGTLIDNHHIVVDLANQAGEKKMYNNDLSVFLGNLPFDIDDEAVRSVFEECGEIQAVRIIRDKATGLGKGFGYVQFQKIKSKEKALKLSDLEINGRKIRVKPIDSNPEKKPGTKKTVMMIRNNVAMRRTKESGNKKSVKKLLKKGRQVHQRKQVTRLLGGKFVK